MSGTELIAKERRRQIQVEGWTAEHDDAHRNGELALAAICYASPRAVYARGDRATGVSFDDPWPFDPDWDKRPFDGNTIRDPEEWTSAKRLDLLVKAGALIAAEIDRLRRKKGS